MSVSCYDFCKELISDCQVSSANVIGTPPSCDASCDLDCPSSYCFTESSGAWSDNIDCNNGTSICCCEEDCTDYHSQIISDNTGLDKDLVKYIIGGGIVAVFSIFYKSKDYIKKIIQSSKEIKETVEEPSKP